MTLKKSRCFDGHDNFPFMVSVVFLASGQYTLSMRSYAPFQKRSSNQRHDSGDEVKFKKL